jgi:hypothetical protein
MLSSRTDIVYDAIAAIVVAGLIYLAASVAGFLGVGVLGLLMMFIAFQVDLGKAETSSGFAMRPQRERTDHAERAAQRHDIEQLQWPILMGKLLGFTLALIGFGELFFG